MKCGELKSNEMLTTQKNRDSPDCCSAYRGSSETLYRRIFWDQEVEITLFLNPNSRGDHQLGFLFDVCGKLLPSEFGFHPGSGYAFTTQNYQTLTTLK